MVLGLSIENIFGDWSFANKTPKLMRRNQLPVCAAGGAPWFPDMFCNFYFAKNHKIAKIMQQPLKQEKNSFSNP